MKTIMIIIGVILILMMFGTMLGGINNAKTDERTDDFTVVTGIGETTADVVLITNLYGASLLHVVSVVSSLGTDVPLQTDYTALTRTLEVSGLTADTTRTLSVSYRYDALTGDNAAAGTFLDMLPLFIGIALVVVVIAGLVMAFKNR